MFLQPGLGRDSGKTRLCIYRVCARVCVCAGVCLCVCVFRPIIWWYLQALPVQQCEEHYSSFCSIASFFFTLKQKSAPPTHTHPHATHPAPHPLQHHFIWIQLILLLFSPSLLFWLL